MSHTDFAAHLILSTVLIIGAYQFYFWCQRNPLGPVREFRLSLDDRIPFWPAWVWIYSFLYYPAILYTTWVADSPREFIYLALSFLGLLAMQMAFFILFPVATPESWRTRQRERTWSERFLAFVQRFDARSNSFPSMHTSVAMLTALYLHAALRHVGLRLPGAHRAVVPVHEAALPRRPPGGRGARLARPSLLRHRMTGGQP